ncbi:hypothetical protein ACVFYP_08210 [Roseomonas sp. F4]
MIQGAAGALAAGAWLGPMLAVLTGFGLLRLAGVEGGLILLASVVGLSLLAGAPAAVLAARRGLVATPLGLAAGLALVVGFALFHLDDRLPVAQALPAALATAALAVLWGGLAVTAALGLSPWRELGAGLLLAAGLAFGLGGMAGAFWGLAAGAALTGFLLAAPAGPADPRLRPRQMAGPTIAGLALALAVLAQPFVTFLLGGPLMVPALALLVALPGLLLVALARSLPPFGLATALLALQALSVAMALLLGGAPAVAGVLPEEALHAYRLALLGAAFLPAFAALQAALLSRASARLAILAALALAVLSAGLGPLLALVVPALAAHAALAAPLLATGFAFWLVLRAAEDGEETA